MVNNVLRGQHCLVQWCPPLGTLSLKQTNARAQTHFLKHITLSYIHSLGDLPKPES